MADFNERFVAAAFQPIPNEDREPAHVALKRLHQSAVTAAKRHAIAPYGSVTSRKRYREYLDANTRFVNKLALAIGEGDAVTR